MHTERTAGLRTGDGKLVPLQAVAVQAELVAGSVRVEVRQRYRNEEPQPIEVVYVFPLPAEAALTGFAMTTPSGLLRAEVRERQEAFRQYDDALTAGHGAALLEQERPEVFTCSVGNLLPGEDVEVVVEYVQPLHADEGTLRWVLPTVVAPRYIPGTPQGDRTGHGWSEPTDRVPDADRITPRLGHAPYRLRLELRVDKGLEVEIDSPSHALQVERDGAGTLVTAGDLALDRDLVVLVRSKDLNVLAGLEAHRQGDGPGYAAVTVVPDLGGQVARRTATEVVFVLDRSGSMDGSAMVEAKRALRLCLRHLRAGDRFQILAFDDQIEQFSTALVSYSQAALERADRWIEDVEARGGTELLQPMLQAMRLAPDGVLVVLTDGAVGNEDEILATVLRERKSARICGFGIGTAVSDALLRQLALRTDGAVALIHPGERIDEAVVSLFARTTAPRVTGLQVRWLGVEVAELTPEPPPALVDGEPWVLLGRYDRPGEGQLQLTGSVGDQPFRLEVPVTLPAVAQRPALARVWATRRIADLEAARLDGRRAEAMKARIVELAVAHGVASRHTAFVVVEERTGDRRTSGVAETRFVPVSAPAGWAMLQRAPVPQWTPAPQSAAVPQWATSTGVMAPASMPLPRRAPAAAPPEADDDGPVPYSPPPPPSRPVTYSAPPAPKRSNGLLNRLRAAVSRGRGPEAPSSPPPGGLPGPAHRSSKSAAEAEPLFAEPLERAALPQNLDTGTVAILGRQLASGLWHDGRGEAHDLLQATGRALLALADDGKTTADPVHGAQIRKAVEALLELVGQGTVDGDPALPLALAAAWLAATGPRTRRQIEAAWQAHVQPVAGQGLGRSEAEVRQVLVAWQKG